MVNLGKGIFTESGDGYAYNNLFLTEWNMEHGEKIELNDLYDFLYQMKYGKQIDPKQYTEGIQKQEFEEVVQSYFKYSVVQLEEKGRYDKEKRKYPWIPAAPWNHIQQAYPFPEVVDYTEQENGVVILEVKAVFPQEGIDCAFRHRVTIQEEDQRFFI